MRPIFLSAAAVALLSTLAAAQAQTHVITFEDDALYPEPRLNPFPVTALDGLVDGIVTYSSPMIDGSCCFLPQARLDSFGFVGGGPNAGDPLPSGPLNMSRFAKVQCFNNPNDPLEREAYLELQFAVPVNAVSFTFGTLTNEGNSRPTITVNAEAFDAAGVSLGIFPFTSTINIAPIAPATAEGLAELPAGLAMSRLRFTGIGECDFSSAYIFAIDNITFTEAGGTPCDADFDGNSVVEVPDIFSFLSAWFAQDQRADFDGAGGIAVPDIFAFLSAWFAGC